MREKEDYQKILRLPIPYLLVVLSVPAIVSNMISTVYNLVDSYFLGTIGVAASGAVGIVFPLMAVLQAIAYMFGQGAGTNISRRLADGDERDASAYASVTFFSALIVGTLFLVAGSLLITPLVYLMGSTETILPYARTYALYILIGAPAMMASLALNNLFRYEGKTVFGMIGLSLGGVCNMVGDALLIRGFCMGISGAGIATAVSQYISFTSLLILYRKKSACRISVSSFLKFFSTHIGGILKNGFPSLIRQGLNSLSVGVLNHCAKAFGDSCISAVSIVNRIQNFLFSFGLGVSQGFQPVAGFNYQARNYRRLRHAFACTVFGTIAVFLVVSGCAVVFSERIVSLFIDDAGVIAIGAVMLQYTCIGLLFLPISTGANMLFQSIGQSLKASFLACLRGGVCFFPLVLLLPRLIGIFGIQISVCLGDAAAGVLSLPFLFAYFRRLPQGDLHREET